MYSFGEKSLAVRETLHPDLQAVVDALIELFDISLISGYRDATEQQELYDAGDSLARPGESLHNSQPSDAVDLIPYPEQYSDPEKMIMLAGVAIGLASQLGVDLRWGGDWDGDGTMVSRDPDESFQDLWHFERVV